MRILDLFCGAGGAAMGYHRAGFEVVGVDIARQPHYPFAFMQRDAMEYLASLGADTATEGYDAIHASPPCQGYSAMSACRRGLSDEYAKLIEPLREMLEAQPLPWVIENVVGAPLRNPVTLCGTMFGLALYRHRLFECSFPVCEPEHPEHVVPASRAGHWTPGTVMSVSGHIAPIAHARRVMGIDWTNREELAEAIPPAYTSWIGAQLFANLAAVSSLEQPQ